MWQSIFLFPSGVATKITHYRFTSWDISCLSRRVLLYVCVFGAAFPVQPGRGSNLAWYICEREINNEINSRGGTNNTVRISTPPHSSANSQKPIHRFEPDYVACRFRSAEISFSFPFPFILLLLSARWSSASLSAGRREALRCHLVDVISRQ